MSMATLAASCSTFLDGNALRVRGSECCVHRGNAVVRCVQASEKVEVQVSRRQGVCALFAGGLVMNVVPLARALLESDDDDALLEKVKEDKRKRIQKRSTAINDFRKESEFVQVAVYKLSAVGQALDGGDFSTATSVLATKQDSDWIRDLQAALSKVSTNSDEKGEADTVKSALSSLQAAVKSGNPESSRNAFIASAGALEKWTRLTGLDEKVAGL